MENQELALDAAQKHLETTPYIEPEIAGHFAANKMYTEDPQAFAALEETVGAEQVISETTTPGPLVVPVGPAAKRPNMAPGTRELQPRRSKAKKNDERLYDGTQLHAEHHGYYVHRDYGAHFFRWAFVSRKIPRNARILDVGCGQDLPFERVVSAPGIFQTINPIDVVAVDWNPIETPFKPKWLTLLDKFDFITRWQELITGVDGLPTTETPGFDCIVNLEVIEHMDLENGVKMLQAFRQLARPNCQLFISTPVFDGKAAANHIHEYTIQELFEALVFAGWNPVERYGTFANINAIKKACTEAEKETLDRLSVYYGNDVLSCMYAPLYPDAARNNIWVCRPV
jgi:2-polyprenyl-3-methyl-5-hydroxy-6-metoxy-1,4-benzoquinol methylase